MGWNAGSFDCEAVELRTQPLGSERRQGQTATDEVHNFETVAVMQHSLSPSIAGHNIMVQLHRDAVGCHAQAFDQSRESEWRARSREFSLFSINLKFHRKRGSRWRSQRNSRRPLRLILAVLSGWNTRLGPDYSALRSTNLRVAVRPSKLACTNKEASGSPDSSTSILISAAPPESVTACV